MTTSRGWFTKPEGDTNANLSKIPMFVRFEDLGAESAASASIERYKSRSSSSGGVFFATIEDVEGASVRYFGCSPDAMFEIDEDSYNRLQRIYKSQTGRLKVSRNIKTFKQLGKYAIVENFPYGLLLDDGVNFARSGCRFYVDMNGGGFTEVEPSEFYAMKRMFDPRKAAARLKRTDII